MLLHMQFAFALKFQQQQFVSSACQFTFSLVESFLKITNIHNTIFSLDDFLIANLVLLLGRRWNWLLHAVTIGVGGRVASSRRLRRGSRTCYDHFVARFN